MGVHACVRPWLVAWCVLPVAGCGGWDVATECGGAWHAPAPEPVLTIGPGDDGDIGGLVVFGDSLSDTGALRAQSLGLAPNADGYFDGRFANGPVWVDYVADALGVTSISHAQGGAATTGEPAATPRPFDASVAGFLGCVAGDLDATALYALWIGHNDYFQGSDDPQGAADVTLQAVQDLAARGARRFLVPEVLPLSGTPRPLEESSGGLDGATADARVAAHNDALRAGLLALAPALDLTIARATPVAIRDRVLADPGLLDLDNTTDRCFDGDVYWLTGGSERVCTDPDRYFFWDGVHPTTRVHCAYAIEMLRALGDVGLTAPLVDDPALLARCRRVQGGIGPW
jgi:thermolabile hemolysin